MLTYAITVLTHGTTQV
ncbi:hypothetical protein MPL3356_150319 [Mesorhizobium plurifarium]|uniref:Uncharacterized protein n=1 Tax=Mesorhizobium plurifarium TaxID=69974 RepID=A0A090F550_MESPL|nr:hypothetical protein MPL3356_150319 [Mesorhizobium plurifarium]CDX17037.1 hypothetical protein MPLB_1670079 [Mesorhizobium sp. ORS 3324]